MGYIDKPDTTERGSRTSCARPPGAVSEPVFQAECIQCLDCIAVCPRQAIHPDGAGYPSLNNPTACDLCGLCADVCMHKAIRLTEETRAGLEALKQQGCAPLD